MKKLWKYLIVFVVGCVLGICVVKIPEILDSHVTTQESQKDNYLLKYGTQFPIDRFTKLKESTKDEEQMDYNIFLYVDPYCESCLTKLLAFNEVSEIFRDKGISFNVIWKRDANNSLTQTTNIAEDHQYLEKDIAIDNGSPLYILSDGNNKVLMFTDDTTKLIQKIISLNVMDKQEMITNANNFIANQNEGEKSGNPILIYFSMEGCSDCEHASELLEENKIEEKYDILTVYTEDSYGEEKIVDVENVYQTIYGIDWYPSFVALNEDDYTFVGKVSDKDLLRTLNER